MYYEVYIVLPVDKGQFGSVTPWNKMVLYCDVLRH
jgi:hypothetical protein